MTLTERQERALELRQQGYNCAQAVAMVFDDMLPEELRSSALELATAALGGGIAGTRGTCGVVTAMGIVGGALRYNGPMDKKVLYATVSPLISGFASAHGTTVCSELRRPGAPTCNELILEGIASIHNHFCK